MPCLRPYFNKILKVLVAAILLIATAFLFLSVVAPDAAHAKSKYVGTYQKTGPWNANWDHGDGAPCYEYEIKVLSVKKGKIRFKVTGAVTYGNATGYRELYTDPITTKFKKAKTFRSPTQVHGVRKLKVLLK